MSLYKILFYGWPFLFLFMILIWKRRWRRFPLEAVIIEKRGDNLIKTNDRVGRFDDVGGGTSFYRLQKSNDTIPIYNYDWIMHNRIMNTNFLERFINLIRGSMGTIFLFRYGSKQYKPVNINVNGTKKVKLIPIKDKRGKKIYSYQYSAFDPRWVLGALTFEVVDWDNINFMIQEQRASVLRRQKKFEKWEKFFIPALIIAGALLTGIFILKFSADAGADLRGGGTITGGGEDGGGSRVMGAITGAFTPGE